MSLRLATSSSFTSSSTPTTTPATPYPNASNSFHVFRATSSPPPVLGHGTYTISRRVSEAPSTSIPPSSSASVVDAGNTGEISAGHEINGAVVGIDNNRPVATVSVEAVVEEARRRGIQKGRKEEEVEAMAQTAFRCENHFCTLLLGEILPYVCCVRSASHP